MHHEQALAARAVQRVLAGTTLTAALDEPEVRAAGPGRALVHELAYGTLRHHGTLRAIVGRLAARPIADAAVRALLEVALYQVRETRAPAFAVVDRAVEASVHVGHAAARGLVNAFLRRYLRERTDVDASVAREPEARWSHPKWWIDRLEGDHPQHWQAILAAGNGRPPLTLRVNARNTTREALLQQFAGAGVAARVAGAAGIIVDPPRPLAELPGFADGAFAVQDLGAQLAAPLLDVHTGMRVLDACAAPGGKTTHLLELADVSLLALDDDAVRLARVRENVERLHHAGRGVTLRVGDAREPRAWWDGVAFDRILADVPCTASGVVRRHPDGKWLRRESDIAGFVAQQDAILDATWPVLANGGKLLYSTCSMFRAENEDRVAAFLARHPAALRESLTLPADAAHQDGQLLPSPEGAGHNQDGFYYALLRKA
jgi:16S rRNA (cytosine967-C5)-methyltransferase